jgi:hypothetical protein
MLTVKQSRGMWCDPIPLLFPHAMKTPTSHQSRSQRFFASYYWLILKNVIGWPLIFASFVAGPLVPGPGGIVLFLIGFALVTFPGKRKLTARVLRGRRIRLQNRSVILAIIAVALVVPGIVLLLGIQTQWLPNGLSDSPARAAGSYFAGVLLMGLVACLAVLIANLLLRVMPPIRRRVRPWLRRHRVRLLPPRWRHRLPHEPGSGPFRLKDEILAYLKRP